MNQTPPEISIIVPVRNVEKYLPKCLDSIESQTFKNWECILVDDGSTDRSGEICDKRAARDDRFRAIHIRHGGPSAARNLALEQARGQFIAFVDPDDVAHADLLRGLLQMIEEEDADVAQVGYELLFTSFTKPMPLAEKREVLSRSQVTKGLVNGKIPCYVWNKLFRREVISVPFPEGMLYEDLYVMPLWMSNIRKMVVSPQILYSYRQRSGSIINSNYAESRLEYLKSIFHMVETVRALEPEAVTEAEASLCIWTGVINAAKIISRHVDSTALCLSSLKKINEMSRNVPTPSRELAGFRMWSRVLLLRNHPKLFVRAMRVVYSLGPHKYRRRKGQF